MPAEWGGRVIDTVKRPDELALERLARFLVEDIIAMSDEEILAEAREDGWDPEAIAAEGRALFDRAVAATNKKE